MGEQEHAQAGEKGFHAACLTGIKVPINAMFVLAAEPQSGGFNPATRVAVIPGQADGMDAPFKPISAQCRPGIASQTGSSRRESGRNVRLSC
jgi:hypothetical protein